MQQQPWRRGVKQGTLVDATLVDAQVRRPRGGATGEGSLRRGPHTCFGYKLHLGVDADSELCPRRT